MSWNLEPQSSTHFWDRKIVVFLLCFGGFTHLKTWMLLEHSPAGARGGCESGGGDPKSSAEQ